MQHLFFLSRVIRTEGSALLPSPHPKSLGREEAERFLKPAWGLLQRHSSDGCAVLARNEEQFFFLLLNLPFRKRQGPGTWKISNSRPHCGQHTAQPPQQATIWDMPPMLQEATARRPMGKWKTLQCYKRNSLFQEFLLPRELCQSCLSTSQCVPGSLAGNIGRNMGKCHAKSPQSRAWPSSNPCGSDAAWQSMRAHRSRDFSLEVWVIGSLHVPAT